MICICNEKGDSFVCFTLLYPFRFHLSLEPFHLQFSSNHHLFQLRLFLSISKKSLYPSPIIYLPSNLSPVSSKYDAPTIRKFSDISYSQLYFASQTQFEGIAGPYLRKLKTAWSLVKSSKMLFLNFLLLGTWLVSVSAFGWKSKVIDDSTPGQRRINQDQLKNSRVELANARSRSNELYSSAMLELKRLEEEPICHRVAAQLLMSNCEGLEDINQKEYDLYSGRVQRHYVESLAASLAICDMERSSMLVPDACESFRLPALLHASQESEGKLQVSQEQVGACLKGLGKDPSHWLSWTSYRDNCLLICQAARSDIDKGKLVVYS